MKIEYINTNSPQMKDFSFMPGFEIKDYQIKNDIVQKHLYSCILIHEEGKSLARLAIYINPNHNVDGQDTVSLGYFECINDKRIAQLLFDAVESEMDHLRIEHVIGPIDGNTWNSYRYQLPSENPSFFMEASHPTYYFDLWTACGYGIAAKYYSEKIDFKNKTILPTQSIEKFEEKGISFRCSDIDKLDDDLAMISELTNQSFSNNFLFTPLENSELKSKFSQLRSVLVPQHLLVAEDEDGIIGYLFAMPNYLDTVHKGIIIKTLARHMDRRYAGLGSVLCTLIYNHAMQQGFDYAINAYFHENSKSKSISSKLQAEPFKTYVLLSKNVEAA